MIQSNDALAEGIDFGAIMRDVENRNFVNRVPSAEVLYYGALELLVEAGERLIKEKGPRIDDECSGEGNALRFTSRKLRRFSRFEIFQAE